MKSNSSMTFVIIMTFVMFLASVNAVSVTQCSDILPGQYNILANDVVTEGICISTTTANTWLDCNGNTIYDSSTVDNGRLIEIQPTPQSNSSLRNCNIVYNSTISKTTHPIQLGQLFALENSSIINTKVTGYHFSTDTEPVIVTGNNGLIVDGLTIENVNGSGLGMITGSGVAGQLFHIKGYNFKTDNPDQSSFYIQFQDVGSGATAILDGITLQTPTSKFVNSNKAETAYTGTQQIQLSDTNSSGNVFYFNSANTLLNLLNTSSTVTLKNLDNNNDVYSFQPTVDFNDDGLFEICPSNVCGVPTLNGPDVSFIVQHFTSYSGNFTSAPPADCGGADVIIMVLFGLSIMIIPLIYISFKGFGDVTVQDLFISFIGILVGVAIISSVGSNVVLACG